MVEGTYKIVSPEVVEAHLISVNCGKCDGIEAPAGDRRAEEYGRSYVVIGLRKLHLTVASAVPEVFDGHERPRICY